MRSLQQTNAILHAKYENAKATVTEQGRQLTVERRTHSQARLAEQKLEEGLQDARRTLLAAQETHAAITRLLEQARARKDAVMFEMAQVRSGTVHAVSVV